MTDLPIWLAVWAAVAPVAGVVLGQFLQRWTTRTERRAARLESRADATLDVVALVLDWLNDVQPDILMLVTNDEANREIEAMKSRLQELGPPLMKASMALPEQGIGKHVLLLRGELMAVMGAHWKLGSAKLKGEELQPYADELSAHQERAVHTATRIIAAIHGTVDAKTVRKALGINTFLEGRSNAEVTNGVGQDRAEP